MRLGEPQSVLPYAGEVRLDLEPALLADRREVVNRRLLQRRLGAPVCLPPGHEQRQETHTQQRTEQLGPQCKVAHFVPLSDSQPPMRCDSNGSK